MMERARIARQPAHLLLASEFGSATLNEKGSGEYDPSFVITKLGAKVNRIVAAGLLERLELRETSNGSSLYQGQLRDPTGLHYFSIGEYNSETMQELAPMDGAPERWRAVVGDDDFENTLVSNR